MNVRIHQAESQYHQFEPFANDINAIHSMSEILFITKHFVNGISISAEMPAVAYRIVLPSGKLGIKSQI